MSGSSLGVLSSEVRIARQVQDDRKVTKNSHSYSHGMQKKTNSERTIRQTLKHMGSSRRPHKVLRPVCKEHETGATICTGSLKLHNGRLEKRCLMSLNFCFDILMVGSDFGVINMKASSLVLTVQGGVGGVMVWGILSWHTLGLLVPVEYEMYCVLLLIECYARNISCVTVAQLVVLGITEA